MKRWVKIAATLLVTSLAVAYILSKVDLGKTKDIITSASVPWLAVSAALTLVTVPPMGWRWQRLLAVRGVHESVAWLTRAYFVSYAVGQVLPDLGRRRRLAHLRDVAASSRAGSRRSPARSCSSVRSAERSRSCSRAIGLLLAIGRYPIGAYLWVELRSSFSGRSSVAFVFFSRTVRRRLVFLGPIARRLRVETAARAVYDGLHGYRDHPGSAPRRRARHRALRSSRRVVAIYASGRAVGIDLSILPYVVLGPLLFLVMLVPFTVNGIGVREAFFVSFLGKLSIDHDHAFACGFLFFVMTILLALPGVAIVLWENVFGRTPVPDGTA